jgi:hypothetical protein
MEAYAYVLITIAAVVVLELLILLILGGGSLARLGTAWQAFRRVLGDPAVAAKVQPLLGPAAAAEQKPAKRSAEPLRLLTLMQREGQLVDFLMQDVQGFTDEQVGAFAREMHRKARAVLQSHLVIEPVMPQNEGETVVVPPGFDPSAVRLFGNLTGQPPFRGTLKHAGWRVKDIKIPTPPEGQDEFVLAPAEVDLP